MSARRKTSGSLSIRLRGHMGLRIEYGPDLSMEQTAEIARLHTELMGVIGAHTERWRALRVEVAA
jgi:hypothetical protein